MERDDLIIDESYARAAYHDEEHGKTIRKKIYFVTALLSIITIIEVALGITANAYGWEGLKWEVVKWSFISLTLVKAAYIVLVFMHLGDEKKSFKYIILIPYILFILYLIYIVLTEGNYQFNLMELDPFGYIK